MKTHLNAVSFVGAIALTGIMAGCAVGPGYKAHEISPELGVELHEGNLDVASVKWWNQFEDPVLTHLIAFTKEHNPQLDAARHRWAQSILMAEQAGAKRKPGLDANLSVSRQERSENGMFPVVDDFPGFPDRTETLAHGGLQLSWEIDLFGRLSGQAAVAEKGALMASVKLEDTWRLLLSEVGRRYFRYMGLREQLHYLHQQIDFAQEILSMDEKRLKLGVVPQSRVDADRVMLARLEVMVPDIEFAMQGNLIQLSVMTTMEAEQLRVLFAEASMPETDVATQMSGVRVDTRYLLDRPDIRIARVRFEQGLDQRKVAVSNLYPRLVLFGGVGFESIRSGDLLQAASRFWNLGPAMTVPLFHAGQLRRQVAIEDEELMVRLSDFKSVYLKAVGEVQVSLNELQAAMKTDRAQLTLLDSLEDQYHSVKIQNEVGLVSDSELMQAEMALISAKADAIGKRTAIRLAMVNLCQAVGGSWDHVETNQ